MWPTRLLAAVMALVLLSCGGADGARDAAADLDATSLTDAGALRDMDGTPRLQDCTMHERPTQCAGVDWMAARWRFDFDCPRTSRWEVNVLADSDRVSLEVRTLSGTLLGSTMPGQEHDVIFTVLEEGAICRASVYLPEDGRFQIEIRLLDAPLDLLGCDALCLSDSDEGQARGCDCTRTCHDACTDQGVDCGLPCNRDAPGYACPYLESEIEADLDCVYYAADTGSFEHLGRCYRCGDGQQCCYSDGRDNGTGSYDICPPRDPGGNQPDPNGCSGVSDHCACDVVTLCGCIAESGALALCGECIGEGNFEFSCNAPGDDATFCRRAEQAARAGFGWCERVGDPARCFERPDGF